jgi:hypothetical protein
MQGLFFGFLTEQLFMEPPATGNHTLSDLLIHGHFGMLKIQPSEVFRGRPPFNAVVTKVFDGVGKSSELAHI